jgi:hypothetical protein
VRRPVIDSEEGARADLGPIETQPSWRENDLAPPFTSLESDKFEIFSYLLLRGEYPSERIFYYGKTRDGGRDILRPQSSQGCELIQCKCYEGNVGIGEIRKELAKLYTNVFHEVIPDRPQCVTFYVSQDLTAPAKDLLRNQNLWIKAAKDALREHLGHEPEPGLLDFARTWWPGSPEIGWQSKIDLAERLKRQPELRDEFFRVKKVIDVEAFREILAEERRRPVQSRPKRRVSPSRPKLTAAQRKWWAFLKRLGKEDLARSYLREWKGLTPEGRFEPPTEFEEILGSIEEHPLTLLVGPPSAGKTFISTQILWRAQLQGRKIVWIGPDTPTPTDGPIPSSSDDPDMKERIRRIACELSPNPMEPLEDPYLFIADHLLGDAVVYIEDPFGKKNRDFEHSLHTYSFFDLDEFVRAIQKGGVRKNCHILISSREGLFERWKASRGEALGGGLPLHSFQVTGDSYSSGQLWSLGEKLAKVKGLEQPEEVADEIASRVELPFEVESVIRGLPEGASPEIAAARADRWRRQEGDKVRGKLVAETEGDLLFLQILALRNSKESFLELYEDLGLEGNAEEALDLSLAKYREFVVRILGPELKVGNIVLGGGETYEPSHSVVEEAISEHLKSRPDWLERLALILPRRGKKYAEIAANLLALGTGNTLGETQDAITAVLFDNGGLSYPITADFMRFWLSFDETFKDRLFRYLASDSTRVVRDLAARLSLTNVEVPKEDAWRMLRILLNERHLTAGGQPAVDLFRGHSWRYLVEHIDEAPEDLRVAFDSLATQKPVLFTLAVGELIVERWNEVPETFRGALMSEPVSRSLRAQENILRAIADHWEKVPRELRDFFERQATQAGWQVRLKAATAAWIYCHRNPPVYEPFLLRTVNDSDIRVPLGLLRDFGDEDYDRRFAEALLQRVRGATAAAMLQNLLREGLESNSGWTLEIAKSCLEKGGALALAVLANGHFERHPHQPTPLWAPRGPLVQEPEAVRLGALHAWAHLDQRERDFLSPQEAVTLVQALSRPYRYWVLFYFSVQAVRLPTEVRTYIDGLEDLEGENGDAVRQGKKHRKPENGWSQWNLPVLDLARVMRKMASAQSSNTETAP